MAELEDQFPPTPPIRNESTRNYINSYSTNSSALSTSISLTSTNTSLSISSTNGNTNLSNLVSPPPPPTQSNNSNNAVIFDKPLPKIPDEDDIKKKSKLKESLTNSIQAIQNTLFPRKLQISSPTNFYHEVHVTFNSESGEFEVSFSLWLFIK
jgi:hypothetical protein